MIKPSVFALHFRSTRSQRVLDNLEPPALGPIACTYEINGIPSLEKSRMLAGGLGAPEMGYANLAVTVALLRRLVETAKLSEAEVSTILGDAEALVSHPTISSVVGARRIIVTEVKKGIGLDNWGG